MFTQPAISPSNRATRVVPLRPAAPVTKITFSLSCGAYNLAADGMDFDLDKDGFFASADVYDCAGVKLHLQFATSLKWDLSKRKKMPELIGAPGGYDAISRYKKRRIAPPRDTELGSRK
jgi:hypothetical protein